MTRAAALFAALWLLALPCRAAGLGDELGTGALERALPGSAAEALGALRVEDAALDGGIARLCNFLRGRFRGVLAETLRPVAAIAAVAILCTAARTLLPEKEGLDFVSLAGCAAVAAIALRDVKSVFALGLQTLTELSDFSHALLPTLTAAAAAAGAPTSAGAKYAAGALFSDLLLTAARGLILPLICAYTAAACANAALGGGLDGPVRFTRWSVKTLMKALALCFTGYLGLTGILSSGADAAAVKAARSVLGTLLPVVGKTIADASDALVSGAGLLRNSVGLFGLLAALGVLALPVLRLMLCNLLYKAAAAILSMSAGGRISRLIDAIGSVYGMVLGLVGTAAVILFLSVFSLIQTVSG